MKSLRETELRPWCSKDKWWDEEGWVTAFHWKGKMGFEGWYLFRLQASEEALHLLSLSVLCAGR